MEDNLITTLEGLGYPIYLQGSLLPDEPYPNSFFTFWNDNTDSDGYYNNSEGAIVWAYSLNFYSNDPVKVNNMLLTAKSLLKAQGWVISGAGYDVASDVQSHSGRGISLLYRQKL